MKAPPAGRFEMTIILVLATLIVLLTIDWFRNAPVEIETPAPIKWPSSDREGVEPDHVAGFKLPGYLRYHPAHTWAHRESMNHARVGIDDFAARLIGQAEKIELPRFGQWLRQGERLCSIWKDGDKVELISPVEGVVTDVNLGVVEDPGLVMKDPYGEGWILGVETPDLKTIFRNLLTGSMARRWMEEAAGRLRLRQPAMAGAVAQDGGVAVKDVSKELPDDNWASLAEEFLAN
jgi:glycine cleavage system H protein